MDLRKIKKLIEMLQESDLNEIEVKEGEESVRINRKKESIIHTSIPSVSEKTSTPNNDINHIDDVAESLIDAINFRKKIKKFPQEWDFASGKGMSVRTFAKKINI